MAFVVGIVAAAPIREESAHRSEMVSQLLFGETAEIMEGSNQLTTGTFTKIKCTYDGYEGWCQSAQLAIIPDEMMMKLSNALTSDLLNRVILNGTLMQIPFGCSLGLFQQQQLNLGGLNFTYEGNMKVPNIQLFNAEAIKQIGMMFLNAPYLWGGRSVFGIDCSGFVQQVYRYFNQNLPRDAYEQAEMGHDIGFLAEAQCGDLAYFDNAEGKITHVGIMLGPDTIIHASGKVRIDKIDQAGILNTDTGERTHQLRIVKRLIKV